MDVRIGELLERLETTDTKAAWSLIRGATSKLFSLYNSLSIGLSVTDIAATIEDCANKLSDALESKKADIEVWEQILGTVEQRRKLAETERRRIVDSGKYLTLQEANAMTAFVIDTVLKNVSDPNERRRIGEQLKTFARKAEGWPQLQGADEDLDDVDEDNIIDA
jgi:hypothetical protein